MLTLCTVMNGALHQLKPFFLTWKLAFSAFVLVNVSDEYTILALSYCVWLMTKYRFNRQLRFARARIQTVECVFQQQNTYHVLEPFHLASVTLKCKFAKLKVASVAERNIRRCNFHFD